uniref:Uncharacterized protein n=1 Tax=Anopheles atroparvus TaxID=41427 RepID=A0A182J6F3_ANOAO
MDIFWGSIFDWKCIDLAKLFEANGVRTGVRISISIGNHNHKAADKMVFLGHEKMMACFVHIVTAFRFRETKAVLVKTPEGPKAATQSHFLPLSPPGRLRKDGFIVCQFRSKSLRSIEYAIPSTNFVQKLKRIMLGMEGETLTTLCIENENPKTQTFLIVVSCAVPMLYGNLLDLDALLQRGSVAGRCAWRPVRVMVQVVMVLMVTGDGRSRTSGRSRGGVHQIHRDDLVLPLPLVMMLVLMVAGAIYKDGRERRGRA